jgi:hypothetical protein
VRTSRSRESGALNEAISDIFASDIDGNWLIGEDLPGGAIRDMADPDRDGTNPENCPDDGAFCQPAHVDDYYVTDNDHGGVDTNSIPMSRSPTRFAMLRIAMLLAIALLAAAGCGSEDDSAAESSSAKLSAELRYVRDGGFAGDHDVLVIQTQRAREAHQAARPRRRL